MEKLRCQATGKTKYMTEGAATTAMSNIRSTQRFFRNGVRVNRRVGKIKQCRVYKCPYCHGFHMTSQANPGKKDHEQKIKWKKNLPPETKLVKTIKEAGDWKADGLPFPSDKI